MKLLKKIVIVILIIGIAGALLMGFVFWGTSDVTKMSDEFFRTLQKGEPEKAYEMTSLEFQKNLSIDQFRALGQSALFREFESSKWPARRMSTSGKTITGIIQTKSGEVDMEIDFVKEKGQWKIHNLNYSLDYQPNLIIPDDETLKAKVHKSMLEFSDAIANKDFTLFYESISSLWKAQTSPEALKETFAAFIENEVRLPIAENQPILNEKPYLDENNILTLKGNYPSPEFVTQFELQYMYEHPEWKLIGIEVNLL